MRMNTWIIGNDSVKHYYLKKKIFIAFYSHLNMEDVTDVDYSNTKRVCKDFEIKDLNDYHDLSVQGNTFLLVVVYDNFQDLRLEVYELYSAHFLTAPGIAM